ncbi:MAG: PorV/PorQ family protein [Candidatus Tenebribacter davisii]|nr:PorV/PorQ family protein [Candidatus Tenebribacter davisii]
MKNKVIILTLITILLIPIAANAVSEAAVLFLLIEPSARTGGMGQAYVAQTDDAFAGYWNTGAMAFNRKKQFSSMFSNWFGKLFSDMYYFHLAGNNYYEDLGNVGFAATYMTFGKQDHLDEDGNLLSTFESYDLSAAVTYGYQTSQNTGVGLAFKFILSDLAPEGTGASEVGIKGRGMSYAFDLGVKHKTVDFGQILVSPYNGVLSIYNGIASLGGFQKAGLSEYSILVDKLDFGLNLQNIGPNITYINDSQSDPLPMNLRMGFSYRALESKYNKLCINADMNKMLANGDPIYKRIFTSWTDDFKDGDFASIADFNNSIEIREIIWGVGAEYIYLDLLSLRSGYILDRAGEIKGFSFGAGVHYTFNEQYLLNIDFAFQPGGDLQDYNQTFSLKVEF